MRRNDMKHAIEGWQTSSSWHEGGLFIGMHWVWWLVWAGTVVLLVWALLRLSSERARAHRNVVAEEAAMEALRSRFAEGEIDEEEFTHRIKVLRETGLGV